MRKLMILTAAAFFLVVAFNATALGYMVQYLNIPGSAFLPSTDGYLYDREGSDLVPIDEFSSGWVAPLYLPDGARIDSMSLAAIICGKRTKNTEVDIGIWERDLGTQANTELVHLDIDGTDNNCTLIGNPMVLSDLLPPHRPDVFKVIDNERKAYFITVDGLIGGEFNPDGHLQLRAVRIGYYVSAGFILNDSF